MFKNLLQSFLPWILYFVFVGPTQHQLTVAISIAAITAIFFELNGLKKGFILSWGTLLFFIFLFIAVVIFHHVWIAQHEWVFSNGTLALIAFGSLAIGKPFTLQYAKEQVTEEKWHHPLFIKINVILTSMWGIVFLTALALHFTNIHGWITYLPSIFGVWFTVKFPTWYRKQTASRNSL